MNSLIILSVSGLLGFLGSYTFLLEDKDKLTIGLIVSTLILIIIYGTVKKINDRLEIILRKIEQLEDSP